MALETIASFITEVNPESTLIIRGYAGTGKTTLIAGLVKTLDALNYKSVLLAPTGRAAKVLSNYTRRKANTIHKKIYRQKSSTDGFGKFSIDRKLHKHTFFIVDEASMLTNQSNQSSIFGSGSLLDDLFTYTLNGSVCRLIFVGDTAQLPPIGFENSPALSRESLLSYVLKIFEIELTDVIRQEKDSGVLLNATNIRENIKQNISNIPTIYEDNYPDIQKINGDELIETISDCYDKYGINNTVIINRSNKRANKYNEGIRRAVLWREEELSAGDFLMVVKNNYFWVDDKQEDISFIANGDIAEIVKIHNWEELYDFKFAEVTLRFIDYNDYEIRVKILLDTLYSESPSLSSDDNKKLFNQVLEDYSDVKGKQKQFKKVKENEHFNALQVKFAYAITCHKAQGGQWKAVFIDPGFLNEEMINKDYLRWLYTSFTRTTDKLYLVNFNEKIFEFK